MYGFNAVVLNDSEILLIGGYDFSAVNNQFYCFNHKTETIKPVAKNTEHMIWLSYFPSRCIKRNSVDVVDYSTKNVFNYNHNT